MSVPIEDHWPEEYQPNWAELDTANTEDVFGEAAFELFKETGILATLAAGLIPRQPMTRDEAILCGLLVKACKLGKAIVALSVQLGSDRQLALFRELLEVLAILRHLLDDPGDGSRFQKYVLNSLVTEREFQKAIERNIAERGAELPIEKSMKRSIENTMASAGVDDLTSAPGRSRIGWPKPEGLIEGLSDSAYVAYRTGSSVLHSQWADLIRNHLELVDEGHFVPRFEDLGPRPQPLYAGARLLADAIERYLAKARPDTVAPFSAHLPGLVERIERLVQAHGAWLDTRR